MRAQQRLSIPGREVAGLDLATESLDGPSYVSIAAGQLLQTPWLQP